jgi:hypothetical protein
VATLIAQSLRQKTSFVSVYHHKVRRCDMLQLHRTQRGISSQRSVDSRDRLHAYLHHFIKSAQNMKPDYFKRYSISIFIYAIINEAFGISVSVSSNDRTMRKQGLEKNVQESDRIPMRYTLGICTTR